MGYISYKTGEMRYTDPPCPVKGPLPENYQVHFNFFVLTAFSWIRFFKQDDFPLNCHKLPHVLRCETDVNVFKGLLKTHLFKIAHNV